MVKKKQLIPQEEPKIFRSVPRIAEYYVRASKYITRYLKDNSEEIIYKKTTVKLPDSFKSKNDYVVLKIKKYDLQNAKLWGSGENYLDIKKTYTNREIECHIGEKGEVNSVYLVE